MIKLFLATSFSTKIDANGVVIHEFRQKVEAILKRYEDAGREVYCAVRKEGWKISAPSDAADELRNDFQKIKEADEFAALIDETISAGVQMEIGYALALGKRITLITGAKTSLNWTNQALTGFQNVSHLAI
jgi:nucleoside 2-deoxyribosyltransferase